MERLDTELRTSMMAVAISASLSIAASSSMLIYLTTSYTRSKQIKYIFCKQHQMVTLLFNLFLGDLVQSIGFAFNYTWLARSRFLPNEFCVIQGTLVQIGDLASSGFVVSIALHTFARVYLNKVFDKNLFLSWIILVWLFSGFTGLGLPYILRSYSPSVGKYFGLAGVWCWIKSDLIIARMMSHYAYIFLDQAICAVTYLLIYVKLRKSSRNRNFLGQQNSPNNLERAARIMVVYPIAYICCTLPLCVVRMRDMSGATTPTAVAGFAGSIFTSSGLMNSIMYGITRNLFRRPDPQGRFTSMDGSRHVSGRLPADPYHVPDHDPMIMQDVPLSIRKPDNVFNQAKPFSPVILVQSDTYMRTETC